MIITEDIIINDKDERLTIEINGKVVGYIEELEINEGDKVIKIKPSKLSRVEKE